MNHPKIDRVIFNFMGACNLRCEFCYVPFTDKSNGNIQVWKKVIERLNFLSPRIITVGGGEPFANAEIVEFLSDLKNSGKIVHVDTNATLLSNFNVDLLKQCVDVIAVPIDGIGAVHDTFRGNNGNFDCVSIALKRLSSSDIKVRVNTVIHKGNFKQLKEIAKVVSLNNVAQWQLYEYMWYPSINKIEDLSEILIDCNLLKQLESIAKTKLVYAKGKERRNCYLFVSALGNVYKLNDDGNGYIQLGSIMDDKVLENIAMSINATNVRSRANIKMI